MSMTFMIPVAPWTCQTPPRCLPCQSDLTPNLVHSGHTTVSTFTEPSYMAGSIPEEHKSCPAAWCQGKPRPGLWLGCDLTCRVTLGLYCFPGPLPSVYKIKVCWTGERNFPRNDSAAFPFPHLAKLTMQLGERERGPGPLVPLRNTVPSVGMCGFDSHQPGLKENHSIK